MTNQPVLSNICTTRPAVIRLAGEIQSATSYPDHQGVNLVDDQGKEFYVTVSYHIYPQQLHPGQQLCVEFGYLDASRPGGGSIKLVDAIVVIVN